MLRLRQVAWVAADLSSAEAQVVDGLGLERCFRDPGVATFGLYNALFPVGDRFLEIVSPLPDCDPLETTGGRYLDRHRRPGQPNGDGGYMVILQTDDLAGVRDRSQDIRIVFEAPGGSEADGTAIRGLHFHPRDVGGAILSVDESQTASEWAWAGPSWRDHVQTGVVSDMVGVTIAVDDPSSTAARWGALLDRSPTADDTIELDDATLRFVVESDAAQQGVAGLELKATDRDRVGESLTLVGTTVTLC